MTLRTSRLLAFAALAALAAGCGGGGSSKSAIPATTDRGSASVTLKIVVPKSSQSSKRSPRYVSASTNQLAVTVTDAKGNALSPTIVPVTCSADPCTATATVTAPLGNDTFDVAAQNKSASGTVTTLSHGSATVNVTGNNTPVSITLNAANAAISSLSVTAWAYQGSSSTAAAVVTALDANNKPIPGALDSPITISDNSTTDTNNVFAGTSDTVASSGQIVALRYNLTSASSAPSDALTSDAGIPVTVTLNVIASKPTALATGITIWYDATDAASLAESSGTTWNNRANASGPNVSGPATINLAAAINGRPALAFIAGQQLSSATGFPASGDYTVFAVAANTQFDSANGGLANLVSGGVGLQNGAGHGLPIFQQSTGAMFCVYESLDCTSSPTTTANLATTLPAAYEVTASVSATSGEAIWVNGTAGTTASPVTRTADPSIVINGFGSDTAGSSTNDIGEVIVLDHAASSAERSAIEGYLKAKWGL